MTTDTAARFASDPYLESVIAEVEGRLGRLSHAAAGGGAGAAVGDALPAGAGMSRRSFFKIAAGTGGGLVLAFCLDGRASAAVSQAPAGSAPAAPAGSPDAPFAPNAFVRVSPDGRIVLLSKAPEIGQGIKTAFPMILAEELDANWSDVHVEQAPINPAVYGRQSAGGSRSIPTGWDQLRRAGAVAKAMLVAAAAKEWGVPASECTTERSKVLHGASGRELSYGALATKAAAVPVADESSVPLKTRNDYTLLGKRVPGVDNIKVVAGEPLFGIDQVVPGMLYAVYQKCPAFGGRVKNANLDEIRRLPGVKDAFVLEGNGRFTEVMPGIAILATSTWAAFSARKKLKVTWDESEASKDSWSGAVARAHDVANQPGADTLRNTGDVSSALASGGKRVEAFYSYPFLAHAPLEPQNCTAWYREGSVELWAPTQTPEAALKAVANTLGIPETRVTLHQTRVGGGFGRRLMNDYVCEAALISRQAGGVPVKLTWPREEDMTHDFYRVGGFHAFKGVVSASGKLIAWQDHFITFSADGDKPVSGGALSPDDFPALLVPNVRIMQTKLPLKVPCGPWRAPGSNAIAFAVQSFLHELSVAARRDHLEFLLDVMGEPRWLEPGNAFSLNTGRAAGVLRLAAEKGDWGKPLAEGRGRGLAFHFSHAGHFAEVVEVSVNRDRKLTVHRVTVAGDIGPIVNLSGAENQCQGSVIDGLSTALGLEVTIENGRVQQTNFHEYPILRIANAPPRIDVHFIQSDFPPTGVGEPALPPLAPALCNAIFAATGERIRALPLSKAGIHV